MRRVRRWLVGAMLPLLLLTLADPAPSAVLNKRARLREGASRFTTLLDWVEAGTSVRVVAMEGGWYRVLLPDGRHGYIWGEHLADIETPDAAALAALPPAPAPTEPAKATTLQDEIQSLRTQLDASTRGGGLAAKADLDRIAERIDKLAAEQESLRQSLDDSVFTTTRTPVDGSAIAGGAFLTIGGIIGWVMARVSQRRRDRRSRIRI